MLRDSTPIVDKFSLGIRDCAVMFTLEADKAGLNPPAEYQEKMLDLANKAKLGLALDDYLLLSDSLHPLKEFAPNAVVGLSNICSRVSDAHYKAANETEIRPPVELQPTQAQASETSPEELAIIEQLTGVTLQGAAPAGVFAGRAPTETQLPLITATAQVAATCLRNKYSADNPEEAAQLAVQLLALSADALAQYFQPDPQKKTGS